MLVLVCDQVSSEPVRCGKRSWTLHAFVRPSTFVNNLDVLFSATKSLKAFPTLIALVLTFVGRMRLFSFMSHRMSFEPARCGKRSRAECTFICLSAFVDNSDVFVSTSSPSEPFPTLVALVLVLKLQSKASKLIRLFVTL